MFDWGMVGGLLLIAGAFAMYFGRAQLAIGIYFLADTAWLFLSWQAGKTVGAVMIAIGMLLGAGVWLKMNSGLFVKDLKRKTKDRE